MELIMRYFAKTLLVSAALAGGLAAAGVAAPTSAHADSYSSPYGYGPSYRYYDRGYYGYGPSYGTSPYSSPGTGVSPGIGDH
jgi:hypothetical protein